MSRHADARHADAPRLLAVVTLVLIAAILLAAPVRAHAQPQTQVASADSTAAAAAAPARAPRASWVADRRDFAVGDIITVLIDDYTISTAIKDNIAVDTRRRTLGGTIRLPGQSQSGSLDARNDANTQQRGQLRRENRFQNEMSVRVVEVADNGRLRVEGRKNISVDKAQQDIVFSGWVRAQDVNPQNLVESYRVADATLTYKSPGPLGKAKQGLFTRILGWFLP